MTNKTYDVLKWIVITVLPALAAIVGTIGTATNWAHTGIAVIIITALDTFVGTLIGVSGINYAKENDDEL
ncbi:hypothetical protein Hs30E_13020 [Lactococcus hodotermopsidis]|uniref:Holin n=1 Tax=Pseudolactococcus hodotermopsidis TaxID=2709157 RepID=A0A6A0BEI4_9LACT|nr:phage holin [Lactococcus hodotermopsidis]GFH42751.1 hypothetical protein Hs30E_13020 [Lactococcus hodotermopsidis]